MATAAHSIANDTLQISPETTERLREIRNKLAQPAPDWGDLEGDINDAVHATQITLRLIEELASRVVTACREGNGICASLFVTVDEVEHINWIAGQSMVKIKGLRTDYYAMLEAKPAGRA